MSNQRENALNQSIDIAGSSSPSGSLPVSDEALGLGRILSSGTGASIVVSGTVLLTGLSGMTANSIDNFIQISGCSNAGNNGVFKISVYVSATQVEIINPSAVNEVVAFSYSQRQPYSLEDDLNYERSDRAAIKGAAYSSAIPTYVRPSATGIQVPANLSNIAGNTLDAKAVVLTRKFENATVSVGNTNVNITDVGNLKHATSSDITGVPVQDGYDAGSSEATYVDIINPAVGTGLYVLTGGSAGNRIYGRTRAGGTVSPNSVEVQFRSVPEGAPLSSSSPYTWESGQPTTVDLFYGYRVQLSNIGDTEFRNLQVHGLIADSGLRRNVVDLQTVIGVGDFTNNLSSQLTNTGSQYVFSDLPDATPSVVEALNTINEQIGNRDYTGSVLTDGYTIAQSLQQLADIVGTVSGKKSFEIEYALEGDVYNSEMYFSSWKNESNGLKSGSSTGIASPGTCSPYQVPYTGTIVKATLTVKGVGVQNGSVTYPVTYQTDLFEQTFTGETKIADIDFSISNSYTVGTYATGNTHFKGSVSLSIAVTEGQMLGLKFINGTSASLASQTRNAYITLVIEEA